MKAGNWEDIKKELMKPIDYSNYKQLAKDCWLFLTDDSMPKKAKINKKAFLHEVKIMIETAVIFSKPKWVKVKERNPSEFKMYVTKVKIIEDGLTFHPVAYNQFDTVLNDWTNPRVGYVIGEVVEWLDE